jgi:hypothetical protein
MVQEHQQRDASETAVAQAVACDLRLRRGALRRWMFKLKSIDAAGPTKRAALDRLFGKKPIEPRILRILMVFRAVGLHLVSVGPRESGPTVKEIRMAYNACHRRRRNWPAQHFA